jgi:TrwC relaxase
VVADVAKLTVGREDYYLCELADNHEQYLSGHGESPGRWYGADAASLGLQGEASPAGFQQRFEGRHPDTGELLGRSHGRNAMPAFDVVLRPTKSVSILYGLGNPAAGRAVLAAHHAGVAEATAYLDDHRGRAAAMADISMWTARGCWRSGSTTAPAGKATRCCTPTWWSPTGSRARTDGGRPWTAGTCTATTQQRTPSTGPPTSASSAGHSG